MDSLTLFFFLYVANELATVKTLFQLWLAAMSLLILAWLASATHHPY